MPSLKIFGKLLTTRPWGQDDLHCLCFALGTFRVIQVIVLIPMWIYLYVKRINGSADGSPDWCVANATSSSSNRFLEEEAPVFVEDNTTNVASDAQFIENESSTKIVTKEEHVARKWLFAYLTMSFLYSVLDLAVLASIYSAASVGTPTNPMGRDLFLRPLLRFKAIFMNLMLITLVTIGILLVYHNRKVDWGCTSVSVHNITSPGAAAVNDGNSNMTIPDLPVLLSDQDLGNSLEDSIWYIWYCIMLVLQATELLVWPCIITNKVMGYIQTQLHPEHRRASLREQCIGTTLACLGALTCFKGGGMNVARKGGFSDVTKAMMDFMHTGGKLDIVFTDLYVAFKMLVRVQRERLYNLVHNYDYNDDTTTHEDMETGRTTKVRRIGAGHWSNEGEVDDVLYSNTKASLVLSPSKESDVTLLKEASHFVLHSDAIYDKLPQHLMENNILFSATGEFMDTDAKHIPLDGIGFENTIVLYAQYHQSGIDETPYAILLDLKWEKVIVTIRGSASLEDMAVDLQLTPQNLSALGKECGFDGDDQYCHKGVLTRAYWIYKDIENNKVLERKKQEYPGYSLVITGHSLGAGCAALLSLMFRQKFPSMKCFAFCPPGGLITERLALECKSNITSFINGADIIPRMSYENMERLRDEALEVLARIKISKRKLLRILSMSCSDKNIPYLNSLLLYSEEDTPTNTKYYRQLQQFKEVQQKRKESSDLDFIPLFPPGRIVHFAKSKKGYTAKWAENKDFDSILLAPTFIADHSTETMIKNLEDAVDKFADPAKKDDEEEKCIAPNQGILSSFMDSTADDLDIAVLEAPAFVMCSRPHGSSVFLPGVMAFIAVVLSFMANNHCAFVSRTTYVTVADQSANLTIANEGYNGLGVSTGLWWYLEKVYDGSGPKNDTTSYIDGSSCIKYPDSFFPDMYLNTARGSGTASVLVGIVATVAVWFASCVSFRRVTWHVVITGGFFVAAIMECLVFLVFQSSLCHTAEIDLDDNPDTISTLVSTCGISWGAQLGIIAIVLWTLAALCTIQYTPPKSDEERMLQWLGEKIAATESDNGDGRAPWQRRAVRTAT